jgi:hypothetical protein
MTRDANIWLVGAAGSLLGFLISQSIGMYQFSKNLRATREIETVHLARELTKEFYSEKDGEPLYRDVRTTVESCDIVYRSGGGHFDNDQINRYLGFFDDLGFYYRRGALDIETIDQIFGAYIVEAYEYEELRKYVADLRKNADQQVAFADFQALGRILSARTDRIQLAASFPTACRVKRSSSHAH